MEELSDEDSHATWELQSEASGSCQADNEQTPYQPYQSPLPEQLSPAVRPDLRSPAVQPALLSPAGQPELLSPVGRPDVEPEEPLHDLLRLAVEVPALLLVPEFVETLKTTMGAFQARREEMEGSNKATCARIAETPETVKQLEAVAFQVGSQKVEGRNEATHVRIAETVETVQQVVPHASSLPQRTAMSWSANRKRLVAANLAADGLKETTER